LSRHDPDRPSTADLPELPRSIWDHGYDWIKALSGSWYVVPSWGSRGWDLGRWPLVIVAHYDSDDLYGLAVYIEGDIYETAHRTRAERDQATDLQAAAFWREFEHGPRDLPASDDDLLPRHRGPYSPTRHQEPPASSAD
jgi:hypothetical protein